MKLKVFLKRKRILRIKIDNYVYYFHGFAFAIHNPTWKLFISWKKATGFIETRVRTWLQNE